MLIICILMLSTSIAIGADKAPAIKELTEEQRKTAQSKGEEYFEKLSDYYSPYSFTKQQDLDAILEKSEKQEIDASTVKLYALQEANRRATNNTRSRSYRQKAARIALKIYNSSESFRKEAESAQIVPAEPTTELGEYENEYEKYVYVYAYPASSSNGTIVYRER